MPHPQPEIAMHPYQLGLMWPHPFDDPGNCLGHCARGLCLHQLRLGKRGAHHPFMNAKKLRGRHHTGLDVNSAHAFHGKSHRGIQTILKGQISQPAGTIA